MKNKELKIIVEKTSDGFTAYAPEAKNIYTIGDTITEIKDNINEVIAFQVEYLEELGNHDEAQTLKNTTPNLYLDVEQFFNHYSMINKTVFAEYIGMNGSHLRKITSGLMKLSDKKALQIQNGLHQLATEFDAIHFI